MSSRIPAEYSGVCSIDVILALRAKYKDTADQVWPVGPSVTPLLEPQTMWERLTSTTLGLVDMNRK